MNFIAEMLADEAAIAEFSSRLDELDHLERVQALRDLRSREQAALFERARQNPSSLEDLVPQNFDDQVEVRHSGVNSLPVFRFFEKRFMRKGGNDPMLWGYNQQAMMRLTGPGYFVVRAPNPNHDLTIDYTEIPDQQPRGGWPKIRSNMRGTSRFVFGGLQDRLRRISHHVNVGQAWRNGKRLKNWFVLVRNDE